MKAANLMKFATIKIPDTDSAWANAEPMPDGNRNTTKTTSKTAPAILKQRSGQRDANLESLVMIFSEHEK